MVWLPAVPEKQPPVSSDSGYTVVTYMNPVMERVNLCHIKVR
jgi:hypothetical protein